MKVTLLGTGTSFPDPARVQSGIMIEEGEMFILIDIGSGVLHRLTQTGVNLTTLSGVFISHFHIDHWSDFVTLIQTLWLQGYDRSLPLFAPPDIRNVMRGLFDVAVPFYRDKVIIEPQILSERDSVQCGPFSISTCPTVHSTHDVRAFKIEQGGKSIVISSDTAFSRDIIELARDVDVLIHECNWLDGSNPEGVHTSPLELMRVVEESNPRRIILTHMMPEVVKERDKVLSIVGRRTNAEVIMGEDLMTIEV
ncbi:MAG: MBL fold metallo-hydrolase [Candidatus Thorarchaeota archaeon]